MQAAVAQVLLGQPQAALDLIVPSAEGPRCVGHRAWLLLMSDCKARGVLTGAHSCLPCNDGWHGLCLLSGA